MQKFENRLHDLYLSDKEFIHKILDNELVVPLKSTDSNGNTILHKMILNNDYKGIDLLLNNIKRHIYSKDTINVLLNGQNNKRNTPIHIAILNGQQNVAKQLHNSGADISLANEDDLVIKMTETEADQTPTSTVQSEEINNSSDMKNLLSKLLLPIKQNNPNVTQEQFTKFDEHFELTSITSTEMPNKNSIIDNFLSIKQNDQFQTPVVLVGTPTNSDTVDTSEFIKFIKNHNVQKGGEHVSGVRKIKNSLNSESNNLSESDSLGIAQLLLNQDGGKRKSKKSKKSKQSRSPESARSQKESSTLHDESIKIIMKSNPGMTEEDARFIKAGLYHKIKESNANLSNMQKAIKLKELVEKAREQRKNEKEKEPKKESKKESKKELKKESKDKKSKEPKESKKKI